MILIKKIIRRFVWRLIAFFYDLLSSFKYRGLNFYSLSRVFQLHRVLLQMEKNNKTDISAYGFNISYGNGAETRVLMREIFFEECYNINCDHPSSKLIIDGGSNIGLATLYFSAVFPDSRIIAFEPNKEASALFKKNIEANGVNGVKLVEAALAGEAGEIIFNSCPGELMASTATNRLNVRGVDFVETQVKAVALSPYLTEEVFLLKLDIEGAESAVLREIKININNVRFLFIEMHYTSGIADNGLGEIFDILDEYQFEYHVRSCTSDGGKCFAPFGNIRRIASYLIFARNRNYNAKTL